ncbi:MAG: CapA family protein [Opitutales bacterium]|nr:CapA family protein [Opitutales bacterium]
MKLRNINFFIAASCGFAFANLATAGETIVLLGGDTDFAESYMPRDERILANGYDYGLEKLKPFLQRADHRIINLEVPIVDPKLFPSPFEGDKGYIHWGDPREVPAALARHNIEAVSLGNNHTLDHGLEGLISTLLLLERQDIAVFGAGLDQEEADRPYEVDLDVGGEPLRLAVFGPFEYRQVYEDKYKWYAKPDYPGSSAIHDDGEPIASAIRDYKKINPDAFVIAYPHWGNNYVWRNEQQRSQAEALVAAGADLIVGHGAHCLQDIEKIDDTWVVYSLGNFLFNTPGRFALFEEERGILPYGLVGMLHFERNSDALEAKIRLYPIYSNNRITEYQPYPVSKESFEEAYAKVVELASKAPGDFANSILRGEDDLGFYIELNLD